MRRAASSDPLATEGHLHGALDRRLSPAPLSLEDVGRSQVVLLLEALIALQLDHFLLIESGLRGGFEIVSCSSGATRRATMIAATRVLKLSEALFAQDIELLELEREARQDRED